MANEADTVQIKAFEASGSYVEWGSVIAGAVAAIAVSFILLSFGSAIGLATVTPWSTSRGTLVGLGLGAAFWLILTNVWAFAFAGYLAARLKHKQAGVTQSEAEFRDSAHGMLAWALAVTIVAVVGTMIAARSEVSRSDTDQSSTMSAPVAMAVDKLLRAPQAQPETPAMRAEIGRVLATATGRANLSVDDRGYLVDVVATRAKLDRPAAEKRVDSIIADYKTQLDRIRKSGIVFGFLAAATLLLGGATAWIAAGIGGRHRDQGQVWYGLSRYQALTPR